MRDNKIDYNDVREYESLFKMAPAFLLERFAKRNSNIVLKFQSQILSHINKLDSHQRSKLDIILNSQIEELQAIMAEAYRISKLKQYRILANPVYKDFIEKNLDELKKLL